MAKTRMLIYVMSFLLLIRCTFQTTCNCEFPHGSVSQCSEFLTAYSCDEGYKKSQTASMLTCSSSSGKWMAYTGSTFVTEDRLCIPASCPDQIANGALSESCSSKVRTICDYSCDSGYEKTASWLTCSSSSGKWMVLTASIFVSEDKFCIPRSCPDQIPNGALSESCSAQVGTTCDYSCDSGYSKVYKNIECEPSTNWSRNPHALCQHNSLQQCPYEVPNGYLDLTCKRRPGDICIFSCREGYVAQEQNTVFCDSMLHWSQSLRSACKHILCPLIIPNGHIMSSCSRWYDSYCFSEGYRCDPGCVKPSSPPSLKCNASGQWQWAFEYPCDCQESNTPSYSSPTGNTGSAVVGGIGGAVVLGLVLVNVFDRMRKQRSIPTQCALAQRSEYQTNVPGRPSVGGMSVGITSPTYGRTSPNYGIMTTNYAYPSQDTYYSSLQPQQNNEGNSYAQLQPPLGNNSLNEEPPAYSSITPVVVPREDPPSYEQVTSNPVEFKV